LVGLSIWNGFALFHRVRRSELCQRRVDQGDARDSTMAKVDETATDRRTDMPIASVQTITDHKPDNIYRQWTQITRNGL
jgi:hypothetical protein